MGAYEDVLKKVDNKIKSGDITASNTISNGNTGSQTLSERLKNMNASTNTNTNASKSGVAELKARVENIVSQSGAALKNYRPAGNTTINAQGYLKYQQRIDELESELENAKYKGLDADALKKELKSVKKDYTKFKTEQYNAKRYARINSLQNKAEKDPDFAQYVKAGLNRYNLLNREKDSRKFAVNFGVDSAQEDLGDWANRNYGLSTYSEDDRNMYLYLLGKEGVTAADNYKKLIERDYNAERAKKETEFLTEYARNNKAGAVALNTAAGYLGSGALIDSVKQGLQNAGRRDEDFIPADNTSAMYTAPRMRAALQEGITGDIKSPVGKFMAESGLSGLDFLATAAAGGGLTSGLGMAPKAAEWATLGLMGSNAGGSSAWEAVNRGATPEQAALMGVVSAVAEMAFEKIPVGKLGEITKPGMKESFGRALWDMAKSEGLEEVFTEYANILGDKFIMGDASEVNTYIADLIRQGASTEDAKKAAIFEFAVKRPGMAGLGGLVSGAGIGAAGAGVGRINYNNSYNQLVNAIETQTGATKEDARKMANDIVSRLSENQNAETETQQEEPVQTEERVPERVTENVPAEFEAFNEGPQGQEEQEKRIWERAAEEQAAYDAEYERTHPQAGIDANAESIPENAGINTENTDRAEALRQIEEQEREKQEGIRKQAVIDLAVNKFNQKFSKYPALKEAFSEWVANEINQKGIPGGFQNAPEEYADYLFWNIEQKAIEYYKDARGSTIEGKMRNALTQALNEYISGNADTGYDTESAAPENRISARRYLAENPEGAEQFFSENYGDETEDIWGTDILKDRTEGERREKLGQAYEIANRELQRAEDQIRKAKKRRGAEYFTKTEKRISDALVNGVLSTAGSDNAGVRRNIVDNIVRQIDRGEPVIRFSNGSTVSMAQKADKSIISAMLPYIVEHDALAEEYNSTSGDLQIKAQELAKEATEKLDVSGKDKRAPFLYYIEAAVRNWEDVFKTNPETAKWFNEKYTNLQRDNNQKMVKMENNVFDKVRDLDIDTGKKKTYHLTFSDKKGNVYDGDYNESGVLQIYGENLINDVTLDSLTDKKGNKIDADKIRHAKSVISAEYKKLLKSINNVLVEYGYTPALEIKDYFPHYNETTLTAWENILAMMGFDTEIQDLPTEIAGRTGAWKPGKQWFGNILERQGARTQFDAIGGFQKYVRIAGNIIYHTGDVQRLRALGDAIRSNYGTSLYQSEMRQLKESRIRGSITPEEYYDRVNKLNEDNEGRLLKFNNLVKWIDESANLQAGKQSFLDRAVENLFTRKSLNWVQNISQRISRNMVNGNVSSSITNFIPIAQDDTGAKYKLKGLYDTIKTGLKRDGFVDSSAFLTNRYGVEPLVTTGLDNFVKKAGFLMETIDHITAEGLTRARYYQNLDAGMDEQTAMSEADDHVARVMADRTRGQMPTIFEAKNPLVKSFTMFQTEVKNQYSWMFKDLPRQNRDKALGVLTAGLFKLILASFIYNEATEKLTGRRAATDFADIVWTTINDMKGRERANLFDVAFAGEDLYHEKQLEPKEIRTRLADRILEQVPGNALFGGRVPILESMPEISKINDNIDDVDTSPKARQEIWKQAIKPLAYIAAPTGGIQAKKIYEGLSEALQGGSYAYDSNGKQILRYPVEKNTETIIKNAIFGRTASEGYQNWKKGGFKNLSAKQTDVWKKAKSAGVSYDDYMKYTYDCKETGEDGKTKTKSKEQRAKILYDNKNLSARQKEIIWYNLNDYKEYKPDFKLGRKDFYEQYGKEAEKK